MCRMLGYVTRTPTTLADLLGEQDLQDFAELSRTHGDGWGFAREGDTDSDRFFLAILSRLGDEVAQPDRVVAAFAESVTAIRSTLSYSSLNSMLVTPAHLYALCCFDAQAELKEEKPEHYHLQWRSTPDAVVVASSGWGTGWVSLKNGQLLVIEASTLTSTVLPLHEETALRRSGRP
jgi:predicted glutamine amidotransferase